MISHDNLYFQVNAVNEANKSLGNTREQERVLSYLPLSHVAGMLLDIMMPPILGATLPGYCTVYFARANDLKDGTVAVHPT